VAVLLAKVPDGCMQLTELEKGFKALCKENAACNLASIAEYYKRSLAVGLLLEAGFSVVDHRGKAMVCKMKSAPAPAPASCNSCSHSASACPICSCFCSCNSHSCSACKSGAMGCGYHHDPTSGNGAAGSCQSVHTRILITQRAQIISIIIRLRITSKKRKHLIHYDDIRRVPQSSSCVVH